MKILVSYATTEGHTRKIAQHVADRLVNAENSVELLDLTQANDIDLSRFDGAILAASIHMGHYQRGLSEFAAKHALALKTTPTLFLSVSLSAAGHDAKDWQGLEDIMADFTEATGWTPTRTEQIAGNYCPSKYDVFRRFIMRRIIMSKDDLADPDHDHDYTDWHALNRIVDDWRESLTK